MKAVSIGIFLGSILLSGATVWTTPYRLVSGVVSATDAERQDCYFVVGEATTIHYMPGSPACLRMIELLGKKVDLYFSVIP